MEVSEMVRSLVASVLAAVLLLASTSVRARDSYLLYDATSTTAGSLDTGVLNTRRCQQVSVLATCLVAACSAFTVQACRALTTASCAAFGVTLSVPGLGTTSDSGTMGPGSASARTVPPGLRYQITAGTGGTAQLSIYCEL
jgi:hypothetical protein